MIEPLVKCYRMLFGGKLFYRFNVLLYTLGLRGMGILNYENDSVSGEEAFVGNFFKDNAHKTVLDVGANSGNYSRKILACTENARIYAFEPHPKTFKKLRELTGNKNFTCYNVAVGAEDGDVNLYDYADKDASEHASIYKDVIMRFRKSNTTCHRVQVVGLTNFARKNEISSVDLLKIDTEGNELDVIRGFSEYIMQGRVKVIQFEFNDTHVIGRAFFKDFWDALPNYNFFRMLPDGLVPIKTYDPVLCEIFAFQNIVAILKN